MERRKFIILLVLALSLDSSRNVGAALHMQDAQITTITRLNNGDQFTAQGSSCNPETCIGLSSGTATAISDISSSKKEGSCTCQCHPHLPAYREDWQICVDDIRECVLSPFVSGSMSQQIPFVFLPLKGQIIHPSKEISFAGIRTPVCGISGAKFLTDGGWIDLRNPLDTDVPFRLFRDEGRTFLQWVGEPELRARMGGRLVLVHLMCKEIATDVDLDQPAATAAATAAAPQVPLVFTPCVAFRIVGTPTKYLNNVSEVVFSADAHSSESSAGSGLSVSEYVAIGISSVLLGLIYVASVFLYLHLRKRRKESDKMIERRDNQTLAGAEEGIIKNNPLLGLSRHFSMPDNSFSDSCSSDTDVTPDIIQHHEDRKKNIQITSAMIHPPHNFEALFNSHPIHQVMMHQESIERLPEENVSIVETIEGREERPDTVKVIGTTRRKLYFNPAYFEPQLLLAPPPAAIEFLTKIREVISIAKQKMASKKFTPILKGIPEEDTIYAVDVGSDYVKPIGSRRSSVISLKRENSRRKRCSGCPGCEPQDFKALSGKLPEFPSLAACHTCATTADNNKQISIRKWLEDIPVLKTPQNTEEIPTIIVKPKKITKHIRSPTRSLSPDYITPHIRTLSPRPASERARSPAFDKTSSLKSSSSNHSKKSVSTVRTAYSARRRKEIVKPKCPPPPLPTMPKHFQIEQNIYDVIAEPKSALPPPDMIHEAMAVDCKEDPKMTTTTKKKMKAVINELTNLNVVDSSPELDTRKEIDYETDSLERSRHKGFSTPSDYAEVTSSQPSPSLSSALPMDEEMTMRNAIINTKTGNMTISKINMEEVLKSDDHDYELIILKKGDNGNTMFKLPELLQRNSGYSLVSEVYVNNGYNYGSAPSTPSESNSSTMERAPKIIYEENKPGHLLIEVGDCADNYIKAEDSDNFEPDTLDRKPKMKIFNAALSDNEFVDSLERPTQIMLRTTGSFKKDSITDATDQKNICNFNRNFGSLREIYEAKVKKSLGEVNWRSQDFEGRILTLEERHCRRQRKSPTIQPDVIPPHREVSDGPIYEHPKPPRKVQGSKPPLPPKNGPVRSTEDSTTGASIEKSKSDYESCNHLKSDVSILKNFIHADDVIFKNGINNQFILQAATITTNPLNLRKGQSLKKEWRKVINVKPEDSGYLSTDSSDSHKKKMKDLDRASAGSETDESLGDGHSESGAESIETHSVFFGSYRKTSCIAGSIDSGVGSDLKPAEAVASLEDHASSSDSETVSYSTVVTPLNAKK